MPPPPPLSMRTGLPQGYEYTADLLTLNFCRPPLAWEHAAPELMGVSTPLRPKAWAEALAGHPDRALVRYIVEGLTHGFRIGFQRGAPLRSAHDNLESARQHPEVIRAYLEKERRLGRMLGPFDTVDHLPPLQVSRFGVIPKGHGTGEWRLITDLSSPHGASVNEGIDPDLTSLQYLKIDDVATLIAEKGAGALLAKVDIEAAYRQIPVHPQDRPLQALKWEGRLYVDPRLPFGLRSAPKIFNAVADALEWVLTQAGIPCIRHYLDDFIIVSLPASPQCQQCLDILDRVCRVLGVPMAVHKREGPTTCIIFLGIEVDTVAGELRLPVEKMQRLQATLEEWGDRRACTRKELESLIGLLNHACKVVRPGRSFLRRMIDLLYSVRRPPNSVIPIRLNCEFRSDLAWWQEFLPGWNGVAFLAPPCRLPRVDLATDASGTWGAGAWHGKAWFQVEWDSRSQDLSIAEKELLPIILACDAWGSAWHGKQVVCHCDNQVVVACLRSRSSRSPGLMHLLRCLVFVEAQYNCFLLPTYIDTRANHLADDLSRDRVLSFLSKVPGADPRPSPVSRSLLDLLLDPQADWISPAWRRQFGGTSRRV